MIQITIAWINTSLHSTLIWFYLVSIFIFKKIMFYPIAIPMTIYIVFWINFSLIKAAIRIYTLFKFIQYLLPNIFYFFEVLVFYLKFAIVPLTTIYEFILNIIQTYSLYYFVFFFKRIELHFFWLAYILFYC